MKSLFIAGALLMTGAAIYGFIDYKKVSQGTAFRNMYQEGKENNPLKKEELPETGITDFKEKNAAMKKTGTGSRISGTEAGENSNKKMKRKPREFEFEKFSRAPLKDEH